MNKLSEKDILEYEVFSCNLIQSYFYLIFPKYHRWVMKRKLKRYYEFINY